MKTIFIIAILFFGYSFFWKLFINQPTENELAEYVETGKMPISKGNLKYSIKGIVLDIICLILCIVALIIIKLN